MFLHSKAAKVDQVDLLVRSRFFLDGRQGDIDGSLTAARARSVVLVIIAVRKGKGSCTQITMQHDWVVQDDEMAGVIQLSYRALLSKSKEEKESRSVLLKSSSFRAWSREMISGWNPRSVFFELFSSLIMK